MARNQLPQGKPFESSGAGEATSAFLFSGAAQLGSSSSSTPSCNAGGGTAGYQAAVVVLCLLLLAAAGAGCWLLYAYLQLKRTRKYNYDNQSDWKVSYGQLEFASQRKEMRAEQVCEVHWKDVTRGCHFSCVTCLAHRRPQAKTADLHALRVVVKKLLMEQQPSPETIAGEIKAISGVRGSVNVASFAGVVLDRSHTCVVMEAGSRGSLRDILSNRNMHAQLNADFRYSLSRDIARGMDFIHRSEIGLHGHLTSFNCIVDNQWVCKVTDYGLPSLRTDVQHQHLQTELHKMLWVAPELLVVCPPESLVSDVFSSASLLHGHSYSSSGGSGGYVQVSTQDIYPFSRHVILREAGTKAADVYAYGIILHELLTFNVPYSEYNIPLTQILEQVHGDPTFRPRIPDETRIEFVELIEQCWGNAPSLRPTFPDCLNHLLQYFHVQGKSLVDIMLEQLQKRSTELQAEVNKRTQDMKLEKERFEKILNQMIPEKVTRQLQPGDNSFHITTEVFDDVTVCFGDIVGFTRIASTLAPIEVADLLNRLYSNFDSILEHHKVYKLGTIGDAYMVASGLPERIGIQHAAECANFALDMMASITGFSFAPFPEIQIQLRVGLHSGQCVAGMVGTRQPHYCLFGNTVNVASRMESSSLALRIQVSGDTAHILKRIGGYDLELRGSVDVKGRGAMTTYWLRGREGFTKELPALEEAADAEFHEFK